MKKLLLTTLFCWLAITAMATDLKVTLSDFTVSPSTNRTVYVSLLTVPTASSSSTVIGSRITYTSDTNGVFYISNIVQNCLYSMSVQAPPSRTDFTVQILDTDSGLINAHSNMVAFSTSTFPAGSVAWSAISSDLRYLRAGTPATNVVWPVAGANITAVTNGLAVTISSTATGGGVGSPGRNLETNATTINTVTNPVFTTAFITNPAAAGSSAQISISGNTGNGGFQDLIVSDPSAFRFTLGGSRGIVMPKLVVSGSGATAMIGDGTGVTNVYLAGALTNSAKATNVVNYFVNDTGVNTGQTTSNYLDSVTVPSIMYQVYNLGLETGSGAPSFFQMFQNSAGTFYGALRMRSTHDGIGPGHAEISLEAAEHVAILQGYQYQGSSPADNGGHIQMGSYISGVGWSDNQSRNEVMLMPWQAHNPFVAEAAWPTNFSAAIGFQTFGFTGAGQVSLTPGIFSQTVATNVSSGEHRLVITPDLGWDGNHWNPNGANQTGIRVYGGNSNKVEVVGPMETTSLITVSNINTFGTGTNFFAGPIVTPVFQAATASGFQATLSDPSGSAYLFLYDGSSGYQELFTTRAAGTAGLKLNTLNGGGVPWAIGDKGIEMATNAVSTWPTAPITRGGYALVNSNGTVYLLLSSAAGNTWISTNVGFTHNLVLVNTNLQVNGNLYAKTITNGASAGNHLQITDALGKLVDTSASSSSTAVAGDGSPILIGGGLLLSGGTLTATGPGGAIGWATNGNNATGGEILGTLTQFPLRFVAYSNEVAVFDTNSTIRMGRGQIIQTNAANDSAIFGGYSNTIQGAAAESAIIGGHGNLIGSSGIATSDTYIFGGTNNIVQGVSYGSAIVGGMGNVIGNPTTPSVQSIILGGITSTNFGTDSLIWGYGNYIGVGGPGFVGGHANVLCDAAGGVSSFIGSGTGNYIGTNVTVSVLAGGQFNNISNGVGVAVIGGGYQNSVSGSSYGVIPGGFQNRVNGLFGMAAGNRAKAMSQGSFVWGDSISADQADTGVDSFTIRASGGFYLTNSAKGYLQAWGNSIQSSNTTVARAAVLFQTNTPINSLVYFGTNWPGNGRGTDIGNGSIGSTNLLQIDALLFPGALMVGTNGNVYASNTVQAATLVAVAATGSNYMGANLNVNGTINFLGGTNTGALTSIGSNYLSQAIVGSMATPTNARPSFDFTTLVALTNSATGHGAILIGGLSGTDTTGKMMQWCTLAVTNSAGLGAAFVTNITFAANTHIIGPTTLNLTNWTELLCEYWPPNGPTNVFVTPCW